MQYISQYIWKYRNILQYKIPPPQIPSPIESFPSNLYPKKNNFRSFHQGEMIEWLFCPMGLYTYVLLPLRMSGLLHVEWTKILLNLARCHSYQCISLDYLILYINFIFQWVDTEKLCTLIQVVERWRKFTLGQCLEVK